MHVGRRISKLRAAHGESLRDAALRTGVSHTTIARIEKGEVTGSFHSTLQKIAEGYGVRMEYLLTGRDPRQDFESALRRLPPEERSRLYFVSARTRVKMVLDFLMGEYPSEFSLERIAAALHPELASFEELLARWDTTQLTDEENVRLAETLSRLTGISLNWFRWGGTDPSEWLPTETVGAYASLMRRAAQAGLSPQTLEMAIDLLIMRQKEHPPA
jgi:transcriptional regulator with XRE-family HTH domain